MRDRAGAKLRQRNAVAIPSCAIGQDNRLYDPRQRNNTPSPRARRAAALLRERGFAVLTGQEGCDLLVTSPDRLHELSSSWNRLPPDKYLRMADTIAFEGIVASYKISALARSRQCRIEHTGNPRSLTPCTAASTVYLSPLKPGSVAPPRGDISWALSGYSLHGFNRSNNGSFRLISFVLVRRKGSVGQPRKEPIATASTSSQSF